MHASAPGSAFFLPAGAHVYRKLEELIRSEYRQRGYQEVISPNLFHSSVFAQSGHLAKYSNDMFPVAVDSSEQHYLKPMNCPGHCIMFKHANVSYRQLPLRLAEFGVCHRNEASGALSGLRRVRRFCQDDAHIFCLPSQVGGEVAAALSFVRKVYRMLGLDFHLVLSSRPESFIGEVAQWEQAEEQLEAALEAFAPGAWSLDKGGGAFYGPKIDINVPNASGRVMQCASIQLDFQLPQRFDLKVRVPGCGPHWCLHEDCLEQLQPFPSEEPLEAHFLAEHPCSGAREASNEWVCPVMIHRAVLGSLERMMSVLLERHGSDWPFWLSPRQVLVLPKAQAVDHVERAEAVAKALQVAGFAAEVSRSQHSLNMRLLVADGRHSDKGRHAQVLVVLIIGDREIANGNIAVRIESKPEPNLSLDELIKRLKELELASHRLSSQH